MNVPGSLLPSRAAMPAWGGRVFVRLLVAVGLVLSTCLPARADDELPGRVGRIAEIAGELFLAPEERATEWEAVGLNYPVISGDNLWVSGNGRAEIDYGGGQFRLAMPREIAMRHRLPQFAHLFTGDGYSAGYYSYLWSDTLTADAWEAFAEGEGPWDAELARRLRESVLAAGNTVDPADGYRAFRGRDPRVDALMQKRGFAAPAGPAPGAR